MIAGSWSRSFQSRRYPLTKSALVDGQVPRIAERLKKTSRAKPDEAADCPGGRGLTEDDTTP
jgi:hypothetical protein